MRTREKHDQTRKKMIEKTWELFLTKGYEKCTMSVVLKYLDISKGEFYHYFASKEDCAKACACYYAAQCVEKIASVISKDTTDMENVRKLILSGIEMAKKNDIKAIDSAPNQVFHQMVMAELVKQLAPVYAGVFVAGNENGEWNIAYPLESSEIFLMLTNFYLDAGIFGWDDEQMEQKIVACMDLLGKILGKEEKEMIELFHGSVGR